MDSDNQDEIKSKVRLVPAEETGMSKQLISIEHIKAVFVTEGVSAKEIADRFFLSETQVQKIIDDNKLEELRALAIKNGLASLQNMQITQADKLMTLETQFKRMRILQLEKMLGDYMAYYTTHGHFYKLHPVSGNVLLDTNGIPMQIKIPNITNEIRDLKESVSLSEGLKLLLGQIDAIINKPKDVEKLDPNTITLESMGNIFQQKKQEPEENDDD